MLPRRLFLTFHGLGANAAAGGGSSYWLSADQLESTLEVAREVERSLGVDLSFTFDDGNCSDHSVALPLLKAHKRRGTFFVCGQRIGRPGYLDAGQLREMSDAGMIIGCHGYAHENWQTLADQVLASQLQKGRMAIQAASGQAVDIAAAPFGGIDRRVVQAVKAAGFRCLFASSGGFATAETGLIPRNTIKQGFVPERDLPRMAARFNRAWAGVHDRARRLKYRFY